MGRLKKVGQSVVHPVRGVKSVLRHRNSHNATQSSTVSSSGSSDDALHHTSQGNESGMEESALNSPQMSLETPQMSIEAPQQAGSLDDSSSMPLTGFHDAVAQIQR